MSLLIAAATEASHTGLIARRQFISHHRYHHFIPFSTSSWMVASNILPSSSPDDIVRGPCRNFSDQKQINTDGTSTSRRSTLLTQHFHVVTRHSHRHYQNIVLCQHFHRPLLTLSYSGLTRRIEMDRSRPSNNSLRSLLVENQAATFFCRKISYLTQRLGPNQQQREQTQPDSPNDIPQDYAAAISKLNGLQSNANYVANAAYGKRSSSLEKTRYYLSSLGITMDDLDGLQVIHVAGTKGKGSTCAFVESILRSRGYRTGFYSSPHLVVVRERIRINGRPISEAMFSHYFGLVYHRLEETQNEEFGMPGYFNFLTVMAFYLFLEEKVDVAIMEVGIGGLLDCTNVVRRPVVTGITSLDFDHCQMLGDTLEKIASQKAGIFKPGVPALTVEQPPEAMKVLRDTAEKVGAPFYVVPPWSLYPGSGKIELGIKSDAQKLNASLAIQLADQWTLNRSKSTNHVVKTCVTNEGHYLNPMPLTEPFAEALRQTFWPGRCQIIPKGPVTYFLDGAHTLDSMQNCCKWFDQESMEQSKQQFFPQTTDTIIPVRVTRPKLKTLATCLKMFKNDSTKKNRIKEQNRRAPRVLVFNCTGKRNPEQFLTLLSRLNFDLAIFTTNRVFNAKRMDADHSNLTVTMDQENETRSLNMLTWKRMNPKSVCRQVSCISLALEEIEAYQGQEKADIHVLVCGSVHLVGGFIGLLDPNFDG